jgi:hypothetical protein
MRISVYRDEVTGELKAMRSERYQKAMEQASILTNGTNPMQPPVLVINTDDPAFTDEPKNVSKAFFWDAVAGAVGSIDIPPGLTERQVLTLFDDAICEEGSYNRKVRQTNNVFVLDALFDHDQIFRIYWSPSGDFSQAEELAEKELNEEWEEEDEDDEND